jgi:hypothetical protein
VQHHETVLLDSGDDAVIPDAISPEPFAVAGQCMAEAARILAAHDAFTQIAQHAPLAVRTELAQVTDGCGMKLNAPARHVVSASFAS